VLVVDSAIIKEGTQSINTGGDLLSLPQRNFGSAGLGLAESLVAPPLPVIQAVRQSARFA